MLSAELFAGCGGLALGMSRAGFEHALMVEFNTDAVETALHNKRRHVKHVVGWPIEKADVRDIDWSTLRGQLAMISGGPPCQPFAIGGKKTGHSDARDMWPEAIRAIREAEPDGFLFENVRNLAGPKFTGYLEWILESLRNPYLPRPERQTHERHLLALKLLGKDTPYHVEHQVVNAADFGAPQIRFRVLIFGIKSKFGITPQRMAATHSRDRLLWDQYVTGEYWRRHGLKHRSTPTDKRDAALVSKMQKQDVPPTSHPWVTVRDAIAELGEPDGERNHVYQAGARVYPGHTGSPLDLPSKALKAGDHGVPGGENMMVMDDGSVRYFTVREAARLVGLPDDYLFPRSWSESMRQLGNAVPAVLAESAGKWLTGMLKSGYKTKKRRRG